MSDEKELDFSKPLVFRLSPDKDKEVVEHVRTEVKKGFNLRQIFTDAVRRNLGVSPALFHENQRGLTLGDLKGLLGETVDILENDIGGIVTAIEGYKAEIEGFAEAQKSLVHNLLMQVSSGELSLEEATESFNNEQDAYATKLMQSLDNRYSE